MLQAGRSPVQVPDDVEFFNILILPAARKPESKRPLGSPRRRWVDNTKMDLREIGRDGVYWINLAQNRE
jgi:hypothetical protein